MQWELTWDNNQVVVGPVAGSNFDTRYEKPYIQNSISTEYLRGQTAGLFRSGQEEPKRKCKVRDVFEMEGRACLGCSK
jgi:hypothetical protein